MSKATVNKVILKAIHEEDFRKKLRDDFDAAIRSFAKTLTVSEKEGLRAVSKKAHRHFGDLQNMLLQSRVTKGSSGVRPPGLF